MAISAFIVPVPSAEPLVGDLRQRFDATSGLGVPAHITVLVPFMDPKDITPAVLDRAQRALHGIAAFSFALGTVARFPTTAYLAPSPSEPFVAMTEALVAAFPNFRPYGGEHPSVVPHLTFAHGDAAEATTSAAEVKMRLDSFGAVKGHCNSVLLIENATGRWKDLHVLRLSPGRA